MASYNDLIETVIKRQLGILGPYRLKPVLDQAKIKVDEQFNLQGNGYGLPELEEFIAVLDRNYGAVAVMGCKMAVIRQANAADLELPKVFK